MIEVETRLRAARGIAKCEREASVKAFEQMKSRGNPEKPPAIVSDGHGGIREALVEVYGEVPPYKGVGRPSEQKQPSDDWKYLQVVKEREGGRVVGVYKRVVYGDEQEVLASVEAHTCYVERSNLTSRHMNGRLVRKGLGFSKKLGAFEASCIWEDLVYNLARPLKTLRLEVHEEGRRWIPRSPAMAAGLTEYIWTIKEIITHVPIPNNT